MKNEITGSARLGSELRFITGDCRRLNSVHFSLIRLSTFRRTILVESHCGCCYMATHTTCLVPVCAVADPCNL
jgi:hypothetical protein